MELKIPWKLRYYSPYRIFLRWKKNTKGGFIKSLKKDITHLENRIRVLEQEIHDLSGHSGWRHLHNWELARHRVNGFMRVEYREIGKELDGKH